MKKTRHIITCIITLGVAALVQQASAATIDLGTAANFGILAGSKITDAGAASTIIGGDVGLSPATGANITGLTSVQVTGGGTIYTVDGAGGSGGVNNPGLLTTAKNDLTTAYGAASSAPQTINLGATAGALDGLTLTAGVYGLGGAPQNLNGVLTLKGDASSVFIFQCTSSLITGSGSKVVLLGGVNPCNVFWQVTSSATLGSGSTFVGTILALTSITVDSGVTVDGKLLAQNAAVTLINDTITTDKICAAATVPTSPGTVTGGGPGVPDSGSTVLLLGFGLGSLIVLRTISRQSRLQAGC